ncbi:S-layer homology domain-containing protein [Gracilibacillus dipsosauri]|uniref:S-layer homology domain-containing protein n=1 Tax=Gracilibacillus dipsosauri TaxID=178340 RepID=UPI0024095E91
MLKRSFVLFISVLLVFPLFASAEVKEFKDVPKDHSHYPAIMSLSNKTVIKGYGDETFKPGQKLSRAHAAVLFINALEKTPLEGEQLQEYLFSDVKESHDYAGYIAATRKAEIFNGANGEFLINRDLTREQMATTIVNAFGLTDNGENKNVFLDNVDDSHKDNVQILANYGITNQLDDFRPKEIVTRGQFATFLYKTMLELELIEEWIEEPEKPEEPEEPEEPQTEPGEKVINKVTYDRDYEEVVKKQANNSPMVDGAGRFIATDTAVSYYLNPNNFKQGTPQFYQFLLLSYTDSIDAEQINSLILHDKGSLTGTGEAFIEAGKTYNVNPIYLIAHALHETGKGFSALANGIEVGKDKNGKLQLVTEENRDSLKDIKKTYNMFGYGAVDHDPLRGGAARAYNEGWFTPKDAILGGARLISQNYIGIGQDTLYKMKWNPDNPPVHQYATHIMWAAIQGEYIYDMYETYNLNSSVALHFEVPEYKNQPGPTEKPPVEKLYAVNPKLKGAVGTITGSNVNFRKGPFEEEIGQLEIGTKFEVLGQNGVQGKKWYKIIVDGQEGWVIEDYVQFNNVLKIVNITSSLNVRETPEDGKVIGSLKNNDIVVGVVDEEGNYAKEGDWYKVYYNGKEAYVHGDFVEE